MKTVRVRNLDPTTSAGDVLSFFADIELVSPTAVSIATESDEIQKKVATVTFSESKFFKEAKLRDGRVLRSGDAEFVSIENNFDGITTLYNGEDLKKEVELECVSDQLLGCK